MTLRESTTRVCKPLEYITIRLRTKLSTAGLNSCKWLKALDNTPLESKGLDLCRSNKRPVTQLKGIWKEWPVEPVDGMQTSFDWSKRNGRM